MYCWHQYLQIILYYRIDNLYHSHMDIDFNHLQSKNILHHLLVIFHLQDVKYAEQCLKGDFEYNFPVYIGHGGPR